MKHVMPCPEGCELSRRVHGCAAIFGTKEDAGDGSCWRCGGLGFVDHDGNPDDYRTELRTTPVAESVEPPVEVRYDKAYEIDEIVGSGFLHMKRLAADLWWFALYPNGGAAGDHDRLVWTIRGQVPVITEECVGLRATSPASEEPRE